MKTYNDFNAFDFLIPSFRYLYQYKVQFVGMCEYFNLIHFENGKYKGYRKTDLKSWDGDGQTSMFIIKHPHGVIINLDSASVHLFDSFLQNSEK